MKKNILFKKLFSVLFVFLSFFNIVNAQPIDPDIMYKDLCSLFLSTGNTTIKSIIDYIFCVINSSILPLIFVLAFVFFMYGVVEYMLNPSDEAKRTKGKSFMIWGIIALTVMFSVYGLINIFGKTFNLLDQTTKIPTVTIN